MRVLWGNFSVIGVQFQRDWGAISAWLGCCCGARRIFWGGG